jgi:hypothetical protein
MYVTKDRQEFSSIVPLISYAQSEPNMISVEPKLQSVPRTAGDLATIYKVSDRAIQGWYKVIVRAHPWLGERDLKVGRSNKTKYTVLCQELLEAYRQSGMGAEEWVVASHHANAEKLPREKTLRERSLEQFGLTPAVEVEVLEEEAFGGGIKTTSASYQAQPIAQAHLQKLTVTLPTVDTSTLDAQTAQFSQLSAQAVAILGQFVTADLIAKLGGVLAQNTHLVAAIQHSAITGAVQKLGVGKLEAEDGDSASSV